jgi:AP2 domain
MRGTEKMCEGCRRRFTIRWPSNPNRTCGRRCAAIVRNRESALKRRSSVATPTPVRGARWLVLRPHGFALIDAKDYGRISKIPWSLDPSNGYVVHRSGRRKIYLHRLIGGFSHTDHRDGDRLNNRRNNLREASASNNTQNGRAHKDGVSKFRGVHRFRNRWQAQICINYCRRHLGLFATEVEAAHAYDEAARRLHGEFACVNFARNGERSAIR